MFPIHHEQGVLDSSALSVMSWNMLKGKRKGWHEDLASLSAQSDIILLQEVMLNDEFYCHLGDCLQWHATEGYRRFNRISGVLTAAKVGSHRKQSFKKIEPYLRTPKAALITEYTLSGCAQTLLVANIHALNFTWGVFHFYQQLSDIFSVLAAHEGPVVLAGDFNVWRGKRLKLLRELAQNACLIETEFEHDIRKAAFSYQLDHIFYRGLRKRESRVHKVVTSDHNPITAMFSLD